MKRWFVLSSDPQALAMDCYEQLDDSITHHGLMDVDALKKLAGDQVIIVVITTHHETSLTVTLPKVKPALLREALPHMIEDMILSSSDAIHCVLPEHYIPGELTTILVVGREWMQAWLDWRLMHALNVQAIIPAYTLLPITQGHTGMMIYDDSLWIRYNAVQGYCLPDDWAKGLVHKLVVGEHLDRFGELDAVLTEKFAFVHPQMMRLEDCLVQAQSFPINYLQGDFRPKNKRRRMTLNALSVSVVSVVIALLMHISYLGVSPFVLGSRLKTLQAQSLALYQQVYPDATAVNSPKVLIARALNEQGSAGDRLFSELLAHVSEVIGQHPMTIAQVHYQDQRLTLSGWVNDFEQLEGLTQGLQALGLSVEQQRAEQGEGKIDVSMVIFRGQS